MATHHLRIRRVIVAEYVLAKDDPVNLDDVRHDEQNKSTAEALDDLEEMRISSDPTLQVRAYNNLPFEWED